MIRLKLVYMLAATYLMAITEGFSAPETAATGRVKSDQHENNHLNHHHLESSQSKMLKYIRLAFVTNNAAWQSGKTLVAILEYIEGHLFQVEMSKQNGVAEHEPEQSGPDYDDYLDYDAEGGDDQSMTVGETSDSGDDQAENKRLVSSMIYKLSTLAMLTIVFSMIFDFQNLLV